MISRENMSVIVIQRRANERVYIIRWMEGGRLHLPVVDVCFSKTLAMESKPSSASSQRWPGRVRIVRIGLVMHA